MEEKIVLRNFKDVPIVSINLQSTLWNRTGDWRNLRPSHVSLQAPCSKACPIEQDISFYLTSLADGKPEEAWQKVLEANPFPSTCGQVCHHPCEANCNRKEYDGALAIHLMERSLGNWGMKKGYVDGKKVRKKNEKVAIIGSGPAGLSCAYFLARKGYGVKIFEAMDEPGGMLKHGIPQYRLPKKILNNEIERILSSGVEIETGKKFGTDVDLEDLRSYAAVFLATGAHAEQKVKVPGADLKGVWHGLAFLKEMNSGKRFSPGRKVVVVGGGNTAIDSARVALRLGSKVTLLYRRTKEDMPAIPEEVEAASQEGVEFIFNAIPLKILGKNGHVQRVESVRTKPGRIDSSGRKKPIPVPGSNFSLTASSLILAVGERADLSFLPEGLKTENGMIKVDSWGKTNLPGIFSGGDAATGEGYVSHAIASGKRAARAIDTYVQKSSLPPSDKPQELVRFKNINLDYFPPIPRVKIPTLSIKERAGSFREVYRGLSEWKTKKEAERCFSCGNCVSCNVCVMVCPDLAISFKEKEMEYVVNYDYCKGCGVCFVECPRSAITMEEEVWNR
jgi:2-oxoacid:acceptor oxidoreductase delta subunit (pyruvate/2-ketoisovalerate family)